MRTLTLLTLALTVSSLVSACNSGNFISQAFQDFTFEFLGIPESPGSSGICGFSPSETICCDSDTLTSFQTYTNTLRTNLESSAGSKDESLIFMRGEVIQIRESVTKLNEMFERANSEKTTLPQSAARLADFFGGWTKTITQNFTGLVENFEEYQKARATCMDSLLLTQASILCLACENDFDFQPGVQNGNNGRFINFDDSLIETLSEDCYDYFAFSTNQSAITGLFKYRSVISPLTSGFEKLINGDAAGAAGDLTKAVQNFNSSSNSEDGTLEPVTIPTLCTRESCTWIETTLFPRTGSGKLDQDFAILGGKSALISEGTRILKSDQNERKLEGVGYAPELDNLGIIVNFAQNPGNVDNTQNANFALRNGFVAGILIGSALFL